VQQLERYRAGDYAGAIRALVTNSRADALAKALRKDAGDWVSHSTTGERDKRLTIVSAVVVELLEQSLAGRFSMDDFRKQLSPLVEWTCEQFRRGPPSEPERLFDLASLAALQANDYEEALVGNIVSDPRGFHLYHAFSRFPSEGRFKLASITNRVETFLISSAPLPPGYLLNQGAGRFDADPPGSMKSLQETLDALSTLVNDPMVGVEAKLRRGVLLAALDKPEEANADLRGATRSNDIFLSYLAEMMLGALADRRGDLSDAIAHYRNAQHVTPATASSIALAAALFRAGRQSEASEMLATWSTGPRVEDPWRTYSLRDYRFMPQYLSQIRELAGQ
jgi:tetratricopeptide (TPR) repeat protein